jgi:hypothetical protein
MEKKYGILAWVKKHKKELIIAGISISAIIGLILGIKNRESIMQIWKSLKLAIKKQLIKDIKLIRKPAITSITNSMPVNEVVQVIEKTPVDVISIKKTPSIVNEHIRNLPIGWKASKGKIREAAERGIDLNLGQTLVGSFIRGGVSA